MAIDKSWGSLAAHPPKIANHFSRARMAEEAGKTEDFSRLVSRAKLRRIFCAMIESFINHDIERKKLHTSWLWCVCVCLWLIIRLLCECAVLFCAIHVWKGRASTWLWRINFPSYSDAKRAANDAHHLDDFLCASVIDNLIVYLKGSKRKSGLEN